MSEIGFGIWTVSTPYWGNTDERDNIYLVHGALDLGINFFDTAYTYVRGYGDEFIAKALKHVRNNLVITNILFQLSTSTPTTAICCKQQIMTYLTY